MGSLQTWSSNVFFSAAVLKQRKRPQLKIQTPKRDRYLWHYFDQNSTQIKIWIRSTSFDQEKNSVIFVSEALFKIQWHESFESCRWWRNCLFFFSLGWPFVCCGRCRCCWCRGGEETALEPGCRGLQAYQVSATAERDFRLGADARLISLSRGRVCFHV